jgi:hypothetical protein
LVFHPMICYGLYLDGQDCDATSMQVEIEDCGM